MGGVELVPLIAQYCSPNVHTLGRVLFVAVGVPGVRDEAASKNADSGIVPVANEFQVDPPLVETHSVCVTAPEENGHAMVIKPVSRELGPVVVATVPGKVLPSTSVPVHSNE